MNVLKKWLETNGGRGVVLTIRRGEWYADAVLLCDGNWPPDVQTSGGEDGLGLPTHQEALDSLEGALVDEAAQLHNHAVTAATAAMLGEQEGDDGG